MLYPSNNKVCICGIHYRNVCGVHIATEVCVCGVHLTVEVCVHVRSAVGCQW